MNLYVVRHGESEYNVQGKWGGLQTTPLTAKGLEQAKLAATQLPDIDFEIIVASSMMRTRQTAQVIQEKTHLPLIFSDEFVERNIGVYDGLTKKEIIEKYPDLWERDCIKKLDDAPTDGETYGQLYARVTAALQKLKADYPDKNVILVAHFFAIRVTYWYCNNVPFEEMLDYSLENCEIAKFTL